MLASLFGVVGFLCVQVLKSTLVAMVLKLAPTPFSDKVVRMLLMETTVCNIHVLFNTETHKLQTKLVLIFKMFFTSESDLKRLKHVGCYTHFFLYFLCLDFKLCIV